MKFQKGSIRKSLRFSIADGLFTAMMLGVSDNYLVPYGIALGAGASQIAFLTAMPMLAASLLQMHSASLTQAIGSRTKLINWVVFFHALSWLPIILVPFLFSHARSVYIGPWALVFCVTVAVSIGQFAVPAWQSLMSDYIPVKKRGKYFGWRNRLQGMLTVLVSIAAGLVLHYFGKDKMTGFTLILIFAMVCRFAAWWCLTHMSEPFRHTTHDTYFSFIDFLRQFKTSNFARFVLFVSAMSFAVNLSSPLLAVFILKDLGFDYASYMIVMTTGALSGFLFQGLWGRFGDLGGNLKVLKIAGWAISFIPVLWLFSHHLGYLLFVQIFAGAAWGGFSMLVLNFIMEAVSPEKRIRCISYFNVLNSASLFLGAFLGGILWPYLPKLFGYSYLTLFLLSCVARMAAMLFFSNQVSEVRK